MFSGKVQLHVESIGAANLINCWSPNLVFNWNLLIEDELHLSLFFWNFEKLRRKFSWIERLRSNTACKKMVLSSYLKLQTSCHDKIWSWLQFLAHQARRQRQWLFDFLAGASAKALPLAVISFCQVEDTFIARVASFSGAFETIGLAF